MDTIKKIKKHGLIGSIKVVRNRLCWIVNYQLIVFLRLLPIKKNLMVLESEGDLSDNSYAFFDFLNKNEYLDKYKVVWLVDHLREAKQKSFDNTLFFYKVPKFIDFRRAYYLATCHWYIYDHCNLLAPVKKRKGCKVINLWHGCAFKAAKGQSVSDKSSSDVNLLTGDLYKEAYKVVFSCNDDQCLDIGFPRNDYLFKNYNENQKKFYKKLNLSKYNKIILWMPTFRRSVNSNLNEDYFTSETGLPILEESKQLEQFNEYLRKNNVLCIFKVHHLQAKLDVFKRKYSNFLILLDEDIQQNNLQLYQVIPFADCLISDYSSIINDFMLLNRPIIYTIDDYEEYKKSRGFIPSDPIKYFAGGLVKNVNDLYSEVGYIIDGLDKYEEKRKLVLPLMHTHPDGNSSQRLIEYLHLTK